MLGKSESSFEVQLFIITNMKVRITSVLLAATFIVAVGCRDRAAEKRIAELEDRLAKLEGSKTATPMPVTPGVTATPAQPEQKPEGPLPVIEFATTEHDFGAVT